MNDEMDKEIDKELDEEPSTREIVMKALEAAVKAFEKNLEDEGWDIWVIKDFAATYINSGDYSEGFTIRIKEPLLKVEKDE